MEHSNIRNAPRSPEEKAFILSRLTFWWMHPLFRTGYRRQLQEHDVYEVLDQYRANVVGKKLMAAWKAEVERSTVKPKSRGLLKRILRLTKESTVEEAEEQSGQSRPSVLSAIARAFWPEYIKSGLFIELQDTCGILTPILIQRIIEFIQKTQSAASDADRPPTWHGYGLVILMLVISCVQNVSAQNWVRHGVKTSIPYRTALVDLMFQKATRLSSRARQQGQFTDGKIINLLSNDTFRIELVPFYLWFMVSIPVFLIVILGFLIHLMGPGPALLGAAVLVIANPLQGWAMARLGPWRQKISAVADRRVGWTHQILRAIQIIKLFAWEPNFVQRVIELRTQEVGMVRRLLLVRGLVSATASAIPVFASAASFVLYAGMGNKLDATIIFPALAFYNSMRTQLTIWPQGFSILTDARVSAKRIEEFLLAEENPPLPDPDPDHPWAIEIQDGCFYWDRVQESEQSAKDQGQEQQDDTSTDSKDQGTLEEHKKEVATEKSSDEQQQQAPCAVEKDNTSDVVAEAPFETTSSITPTATSADNSRHVFLRDINLRIQRRALVAVIGAVGHGKSSLLQAMVGNMPMQSGHLVRGAAMSFAPQQAWIQNATVRDNILFGLPYDQQRYTRTLRACQLEKDMASLAKGDLTELGERGVNLSGGQKARVSLARAVYFQTSTNATSDVDGNVDRGEKTLLHPRATEATIIMDDPLAAVDTHVGKRLWRDCILTELQERTRIIATHHLHVLPDVDLIIYMKHGRIAQIGTYAELMADPSQDDFRTLVAEFGGDSGRQLDKSQESSISGDKEEIHDGAKGTEDTIETDISTIQFKDKTSDEEEKVENVACPSDDDDGSAVETATNKETQATGKQMVQEERKYGAITFQAYRRFFSAVGWALWGGVFGAYLVQQAASVTMNLWLSFWSSDKYQLTHWQYIGIYIGLVLGQLLFIYLASMLLGYVVAKTGKVLHHEALTSVLRAKMTFFETRPLGQILSRFSKDVDSLDNTLHSSMNDYLTVVYALLGIMVLMIVLIPWMAIAIPPLGCLFYFISVYSRATTRELKRLDSVIRAELVSYQAASLSGMETIRVFDGALERCIAQSQARQDRSNRPGYVMQYSTRWSALNGILIGHVMTLIANLVILARRQSMDPGQVGLVLSYLIQVGSLLNWTLQRYSAMEMALNSAERLDDYIHAVDHEVDPLLQGGKISPIEPEWPQHGHVRFTNVWMRYRPDLPWVLKGVSFDIDGGQKVGVVGRTGAGKSSLIQALFRLVDIESSFHGVVNTKEGDEAEAEPASIVIDGHRIDQVELSELRSRLAIIPQDPTLFEGTIRFNLDPLARHPEQALWRALEMADLKRFVQEQEGGLDAPVAAQGENLSVGQRQLLCLARALLLQAKVVVLDEATANVDLATDRLIQKAIRVDFANSTVITIAHRLNTIIDFDKVLVLDQGRLVEFDSPHALLSRPGSLFGQLVDETGEQNAANLRALAAKRGVN